MDGMLAKAWMLRTCAQHRPDIHGREGNQLRRATLCKQPLNTRNAHMARTSTRSRRNSKKAKARAARPQTMPFYSDMLGIAGSLLRSRQQQGAEQIASLAGAARNIAGELDDVPTIQAYAESAASQLAYLSEYVAEQPLEDMVEDATDFARHYPVATMAFAVAAGFAFTRLMVSNSKSAATAKTYTRSSRSASSKRSTAAGRSRANGRDHARGPEHAA
jgi:hypothetical protein